MYHLFKGLHEYLTRKDEYSVVIIGLDNAGKTTMLERVKTLYNPTPGMPPEKIGPTVGQNIGKISLPSTTIRFFDLGGQRDIRSIWPKYYDECHAVVFVLDAVDQGRLAETWEVFDEVLSSPRLLHLPLLLLANKQDVPTSLSVSEIRESFDAWQRSRTAREMEAREQAENAARGKGKGRATEEDMRKAAVSDEAAFDAKRALGGRDKGMRVDWRDQNADGHGDRDGDGMGRGGRREFDEREERLASLDVLGVSALQGTGVKEAVNWLYLRVQDAKPMDDRY